MNPTTQPDIVCQRLLIHGTVQGVGYRIHAQRKAQQLQLVGWVRNLVSGEVEALMSGSKEACEQFVQWAQQGPEAARVDGVQVFATNASEQAELAACTAFNIGADA